MIETLTEIYNAVAAVIENHPILSAGVAIGASALFPFGKKKVTDFVQRKLDERTMRKSGMSDVFQNTAINNDKIKAHNAVSKAFRNNRNLEYAFVEFSNRVLIKKHGEETIELNFRKEDSRVRDSQTWSMIKGMIGQTKPDSEDIYSEEDLYIFARNCTYGDRNNGNALKDPLEELDEVNTQRIKEHAGMRCSWMNKLYDKKTAREASTETIAAHLESITGHEGDDPTTNTSEAGIFGFRWKNNKNKNSKKFSILIKPRTDNEREIIQEIFKRKSLDIGEEGRHLNGRQGLERYAQVKTKMREKDNAQVVADNDHNLRKKMRRFRIQQWLQAPAVA